MSRKSIATNVARKLWAQCGGFCQNPNCNKYLFTRVEDDVVSLANVAHIIGHGKNGPRSEHELADYIAVLIRMGYSEEVFQDPLYDHPL